MLATRVKILLTLGRHRSPYAGILVYGEALSSALAAEVVARGEESLFTFSTEGGVCVTSRKWSILADLCRAHSGYALVHGMANVVSFCGSAKKVVTIHDLLQLFPPQLPTSFAATLYQKARSLWHRTVLRVVLARVDAIVTVHPRVRDELRSVFGLKKPITVVYSPLADEFIAAPLPDQGNARKPYVLAFAAQDRRKNIFGAIEAFSKVAHSATPHVALKLLVVLSYAPLEEEIRVCARRFGVEAQLEIHQGVSTADLVTLYQHATAVLFPSLAEGFGYPIYEALSQGAPVVCEAGLLIEELSQWRGQMVFECEVRKATAVASALLELLSSPATPLSARIACALKTREVVSAKHAVKQLLPLYCALLGFSSNR